MMNVDEKHASALSLPEVKAAATALAQQLKSAKDLSPSLRAQLISVRSSLFQLGIYDPILGRLDSATVPRASIGEIADELAKVASSL